jgi:hypothetical protein
LIGDLVANTPLERAYIWALSTTATLEGRLVFKSELLHREFQINCTALEPARIFPNQNPDSYDFTRLNENTIYCAQEKVKRKSPTSITTSNSNSHINSEELTHPLCDIFFKSGDVLVVIDITGAGLDLAKRKRKRLAAWIAKVHERIENPDSTAANQNQRVGSIKRVHGLVLAPSVREMRSPM